MTQPTFVPIGEADQVRRARRLSVPGPWTAQRPAELRVPYRPSGPGIGTPGPDQGFALHLAERFTGHLHLSDGEAEEDVLAGCALLASRRAALFGRAPCVHDLTVALSLWGYLGAGPAELVAERRAAFLGASHDYDVQRALSDRVPEASLRLAPDDVARRSSAGDWRRLLGVGERGAAAPPD